MVREVPASYPAILFPHHSFHLLIVRDNIHTCIYFIRTCEITLSKRTYRNFLPVHLTARVPCSPIKVELHRSDWNIDGKTAA